PGAVVGRFVRRFAPTKPPQSPALNGESDGQTKAVPDSARLLRWYGINFGAHQQNGSPPELGSQCYDRFTVHCWFCTDVLSVLGNGSRSSCWHAPIGYDWNVTSSKARR